MLFRSGDCPRVGAGNDCVMIDVEEGPLAVGADFLHRRLRDEIRLRNRRLEGKRLEEARFEPWRVTSAPDYDQRRQTIADGGPG